MRWLLPLLCLVPWTRGELPEEYPSVPMRGACADGCEVNMPLIGIGTWLYNETVAEYAVKTAFQEFGVSKYICSCDTRNSFI